LQSFQPEQSEFKSKPIGRNSGGQPLLAFSCHGMSPATLSGEQLEKIQELGKSWALFRLLLLHGKLVIYIFTTI